MFFSLNGGDYQTVIDFPSDLVTQGGDPAKIDHVCQDMSAASAKGVARRPAMDEVSGLASREPTSSRNPCTAYSSSSMSSASSCCWET